MIKLYTILWSLLN